MATTKTKANGSVSMTQEANEILSTLKNKNIKLPMLKEATLIYKLMNRHNMKPSLIEKKTSRSSSHIYNLINLASMTPKMKALVKAGTIKGTDALSIMRKTNNEEEFIRLAEELSKNKKDMRRKEFKVEGKVEQEMGSSEKKERIKKLIMGILGEKKMSKTQNNTINSLVEKLVA